MGRYLGSAQDPGCTSVPVAGKYQLDLLYTLPIRRRWAAQAKLVAKPATHLCPFPSMKHPRMPRAAHISQAPRTEEATPHSAPAPLQGAALQGAVPQPAPIKYGKEPAVGWVHLLNSPPTPI